MNAAVRVLSEHYLDCPACQAMESCGEADRLGRAAGMPEPDPETGTVASADFDRYLEDVFGPGAPERLRNELARELGRPR